MCVSLYVSVVLCYMKQCFLTDRNLAVLWFQVSALITSIPMKKGNSSQNFHLWHGKYTNHRHVITSCSLVNCISEAPHLLWESTVTKVHEQCTIWKMLSNVNMKGNAVRSCYRRVRSQSCNGTESCLSGQHPWVDASPGHELRTKLQQIGSCSCIIHFIECVL